MAQSNHERVGRALDVLNAGLRPFVERELQAAYGKDWVARAKCPVFAEIKSLMVKTGCAT
jgi:Swt1-like HEPN